MQKDTIIHTIRGVSCPTNSQKVVYQQYHEVTVSARTGPSGYLDIGLIDR